MARHRLALSAIGAVSFLIGCGEGVVSDQQVIDDLPSSVFPNNPQLLTDVACPDGVDPRDGVVRECSAQIDGDPVTLRLGPATGDSGRDLSVTVVEPLLRRQAINSDAGERLSADLGRAVRVECDMPGAVVARADRVISCTAIDDASHTLRVVLLDDTGRYEIELG